MANTMNKSANIYNVRLNTVTPKILTDSLYLQSSNHIIVSHLKPAHGTEMAIFAVKQTVVTVIRTHLYTVLS